MIICHFNHLSETCELHELFFGHEALLLLLEPVLISAPLSGSHSSWKTDTYGKGFLLYSVSSDTCALSR